MDVRDNLYQRVPLRAEECDSKTSLAEDYKTYVEYYTADRLPKIRCHCGRVKCLAALITGVLVIVLIFSSYRGHTGQAMEVQTPMKSLGGELHCDEEIIRPSLTIPTNVNQVRPADIKVVAAMGDSITAATYSKNFEEEHRKTVYPGNSYISGGDGTLQDQITVGKILRELNHGIMGLSQGEGYKNTGFNVAISGRTSEDLPRQASELVSRMRQQGVNLAGDWKLVTIFIGTNDLQKFGCTGRTSEPISREDYKAYLVKAISFLRENLNRTIVSIIPMWNSQLAIEAHSLILDEKRLQCGDHYMEKRDILCGEYRKAAYEIQDSRMFDREDFTVVVQGFMDEITDAFRNSSGVYDKTFYAVDMFHMSKYGNAVLGKFLWNALLEPVGNKTARPNLGDDSVPLKCPTKDRPYIQTLNNR
ncbi:unnamed protein product [Cylicocyclus nassatus]|uniref:Uncharacterized protein n=1 Tax=Cylicocyclus nassatus TaxID=53992 RepID=A0AA36DNG6_CYLNA|nr:unnamed protein product [Cylicocyclus nassatus]